MRRLLVLVVLLASVGLTACASSGGRRAQTAPQAPVVQRPVVLQTPDCFDPMFLAEHANGVTEAFSNECSAPIHGVVESRGFFKGMPMDGRGQLFCQFTLRAGGKKMGPALWAQSLVSQGDTSTSQLVIHGDYIATVTNSDKTFALAQRATVHLDTRSQGVVKFVCGGSR